MTIPTPEPETQKPTRRIAGRDTWAKATTLIADKDKKHLVYVLLVVVLTALSTALMVVSILPFLAVLSNSDAITEMQSVRVLAGLLNLSDPYAILVAVGLTSMSIIILASILQIWRLLVLERFAATQAMLISKRLLAIYLDKPYAFFLNRHSSDMATAVLSEVGEVVSFFVRPALNLVAAGFTLMSVSGLMIWLSPSLALAVFGVIGGAFAVTYLLTRSFVRREGAARLAANVQRYRVTNEALDGIKEVKLLGLERRYVQDYETPAKRMVDAIVAVRIVVQLPRNIIYALASAGVVLLCLWLVPKDAYLSGDGLSEVVPLLGVFALGAQRLIPELQKVYGAVNDMQYGIAAVDKLYADLQGVPEPTFDQTLPQIRLKNKITLTDICFSYPRAERAGLRDVSLTIQSGERIGIVGSTGAGKTTLADILMGLLTPSSGRVEIDGKAVSTADLPGWQKSVGYVPQDIYLTDTSMAENIAFGIARADIDDARMRQAATTANLAQFINTELPDGYETTLGERGVRLSGGQRQRIGIARALYRDSDFIVFDEATSALDTLTETDIMAALNAMPDTKTLVLIAHRLSSLRACDRIVVLHDGQIDGVGTWDDLLAGNTIFQNLVAGGALGSETVQS